MRINKTNKIRALVIFGTRPEAIKMAPVVKELKKDKRHFETIVCVTGQHRQMLDQMLNIFGIKADYDLNLMRANQSLEQLTANAITAVSRALQEIKPDIVLVQGDTTTAMAAALAGFYQKTPIGHVEAGLRTRDIYNPFPEEANRRIISVLASFNFAPTKYAVETLLKEKIARERVFFTGNTVVDALREIARGQKKEFKKFKLGSNRRLILVTAHRRENFGRPLKNICAALKKIIEQNADVEIIYPVHLNPNVREPVYKLLSGIERIHLAPPIEYDELVFLMKKAYLVLTDSGGIQEEAPTFGKPVLVMRKETERPEGVKAGVAVLVGTEVKNIVRQVEWLLYSPKAYAKMSRAVSPYGDGRAAKRIVRVIRKQLVS